jgi:threonine dehydratase
LIAGEAKPLSTSYTIMTGMDCGTVSSISWPILRQVVGISLTVSDYESHIAIGDLAKFGVKAGPCGAATLAAVQPLSKMDDASLWFTPETVLLLLSTEGERSYTTL